MGLGPLSQHDRILALDSAIEIRKTTLLVPIDFCADLNLQRQIAREHGCPHYP
jgi:hypothetical protein